jgi:hypothetical protein
VVIAFEFPGALNGQQIAGICNHANYPDIAFLIYANIAMALGREVAATQALAHLLARR